MCGWRSLGPPGRALLREVPLGGSAPRWGYLPLLRPARCIHGIEVPPVPRGLPGIPPGCGRGGLFRDRPGSRAPLQVRAAARDGASSRHACGSRCTARARVPFRGLHPTCSSPPCTPAKPRLQPGRADGHANGPGPSAALLEGGGLQDKEHASSRAWRKGIEKGERTRRFRSCPGRIEPPSER